MHELAIASQLLERALATADEHGADRIDGMTVAVGEASHVATDQLAFCLDAEADGTVAADAEIEIETVEPEGRCPACGWTGTPERVENTVAVRAPDRTCPDCEQRIELTAGDDCRLRTIEIP